ncbi:MAG: nuclear transport factor 2 family protein [Leptolyngbya sp. SIO3F4]|nr:nuclear transport factor 2 family protein [Leptolyngbya sp. SIO3F4]
MTHPSRWSLLSIGVLGMSLWSLPVQAAPPETAPPTLVNALKQIELASNEQDIEAVMAFYTDGFQNNDGFSYETLEATLPQLWERYDTLSYRVELQSWEEVDSGYVAETVTYIDGIQTMPRRMALESVIHSRQEFMGGKIISQEILSERNELHSETPAPEVVVILPERVEPGSNYGFDAIVQEPLGERYLLGAALDEGTTPEDFFVPRPIDLELLSAGGLFKVGDAPESDDNLWVSGLLIREDGLVVITRRLRVE